MSSAIHKCPNCGANLHFDAASAKVACQYCQSEFDVAEVASLHEAAERQAAEQAEQRRVDTEQYQAETHGYHCENCGAEVVTDNETSSGFCYYCHSPVIFSDKISGDFLPDYIIPFKLNKKQAKHSFRQWVKKFKLVPKDFAAPEQLEKITGVYVPYWMADAVANFDVSGTGDVVKTWRSGDKKHTKTSRYRFERKGTMQFNQIKTIASDKVDRALINSVESNTKGKLVPFSTAYLSGFFSQRYTIERDQIADDTVRKVKGYLHDMLARELTYQNINYQRDDSKIDIAKWSYVLLPMWLLTYKFGNKIYVYALNGENGESFGQLPVSYGKLALHALLGLVAIAGALLIGGQFLW